MSENYTKGKWEICSDGICDYGYLIGIKFNKKEEKQLASIHCRNKTKCPQQKDWPEIYPTKEEAKANAERICECVNNYDELKSQRDALLKACKDAKKYLEPDLIEPGRTVFWKLVDAIRQAEKKGD